MGSSTTPCVTRQVWQRLPLALPLSPPRLYWGCRSTGERGTSVPHVPRLNRTNLRFCKSYCCTVLFSLFNTVPNIVSLVRSGFLPVSVCFFQNSDLRIHISDFVFSTSHFRFPIWISYLGFLVSAVRIQISHFRIQNKGTQLLRAREPPHRSWGNPAEREAVTGI